MNAFCYQRKILRYREEELISIYIASCFQGWEYILWGFFVCFPRKNYPPKLLLCVRSFYAEFTHEDIVNLS